MHKLKYKILLSILLPVFIVLTTISSLTIYNKNNTERQLLVDRLDSYLALLESGDLSFSTIEDKTKLEVLLAEQVNIAEIVQDDYSLLYTSNQIDFAAPYEHNRPEIDRAFQGVNTIKNVRVNDQLTLEYISPLVVNDKIVAAVHLSLSYIESDKRVREYTVYTIILALVGLFICYFLSSLLLKRSVLDNISKFKQATAEVQGGNLDYKITVETQDEIGELAAMFNKMSGRLQFYTGELKKKVAERTAELDKKVKELAAGNVEIGESKAAIMNLLEDARSLGASLQEERDRVKTIISSMGEGLIVVDHKNKITMANPTAGKLLKLSPEKLVGQELAKAVPLYSDKEVVAPDKHPVAQAMKNGKVVVSSLEDNFYLSRSSGRKFSVIMVVAPLFKEGISGAVMMFRDTSEEKALDEAKIGFISVASHQLRTPLTSMRWFSEMLIDGDAGDINEEQKHFIERIYQGTERMINLVNLLLQIARVEAGRLKIEPVMVDFKNTTQGIVFTLKANLEAKKQEVVITTDPDPFPSVPMDQEVIWQVIQNLLSNASRYAPEGSKIFVSIVKKGDMIEYSVKDSGIGIPKEYQSRIFEKFYRAENALKLVPEGSGLGLSLVKMLVERWGGKIWFETEENKGTTFFFTIPLEGMKYKEGEVGLGV